MHEKIFGNRHKQVARCHTSFCCLSHTIFPHLPKPKGAVLAAQLWQAQEEFLHLGIIRRAKTGHGIPPFNSAEALPGTPFILAKPDIVQDLRMSI